jgi:hypothetical protein
MKKGVILYHSNIKNIYKERWVKKSIESMINQSDSDLHFYEINYGKENYSLLDNYNIRKKFWFKHMDNHAEAMNFILDEAFLDQCDIVFNVNLDDYYHKDRVKIQSKEIKDGNYDLVSSDFCYIKEDENETDEIFHQMHIARYAESIKENLLANHNVIAHPCVCYNKKFWFNNRYDTSRIPEEDLDLWKRSVVNGYRIKIVPDVLLYYRIHETQITAKNRR